MEVPLPTRALLLILASASALLGQADAREIVRRAVAADERNWKVARNYTFSERVNLKYLDSQGGVKSQEVRIQDVMLLDGSPYRRLVARDGLPLPPVEQTFVNDEVWLPCRVQAFASARLGLLKVLRFEQEINYTKCRGFRTDSPGISQIKAR